MSLKKVRSPDRDRQRQELNRVTDIEDNNKTFRTAVVAFWLLSNMVLALAVDNYGGWLVLSDPSLTREEIQLFHARQTQGRRSFVSGLVSVTYLLIIFRFSGVRLASRMSTPPC
jgi:hypothetical protein